MSHINCPVLWPATEEYCHASSCTFLCVDLHWQLSAELKRKNAGWRQVQSDRDHRRLHRFRQNAGYIPEECQHLGTRNGASPLEESLSVGCTILLPRELNSKWIAVNDLKITYPEDTCNVT